MGTDKHKCDNSLGAEKCSKKTKHCGSSSSVGSSVSSSECATPCVSHSASEKVRRSASKEPLAVSLSPRGDSPTGSSSHSEIDTEPSDPAPSPSRSPSPSVAVSGPLFPSSPSPLCYAPTVALPPAALSVSCASSFVSRFCADKESSAWSPACDPFTPFCGVFGAQNGFLAVPFTGTQRLFAPQFAEERMALENMVMSQEQLVPLAVEGEEDEFGLVAEPDESCVEDEMPPLMFEHAKYDDVCVDQSELQWMNIVEDSPSSAGVQPQLRLVLPHGEHALLDADFGVRVAVPLLNETPNADGILTYCRSRDAPSATLFVVRRKTDIPACPDYAMLPPAMDPATFRWLRCEGETLFVFGMRAKAELRATKLLNVWFFDTVSQSYCQRDVVCVENPLQPQKKLFLDVYAALKEQRGVRGEFVQQNSLGEVYCGWRHCGSSGNGGADGVKSFTLRCGAAQRVVLKLIDCRAPGALRSLDDVADAIAPSLALRNESFVQEIKAMHFLRSLSGQSGVSGGDSDSGSGFHHYASLLQHPGRLLAMTTRYEPDRCLLTFAVRHKHGRGFAEDEAKHVTRHVLRQLSVMHAHGFAHQDISSENILLQRVVRCGERERDEESERESERESVADVLRLRCLLMDYGQSKAVPFCPLRRAFCAVRAKLDRPVGKPSFHAPELVSLSERHALKGELYDAYAVDAYQLGLTLFVLLFGCLPFVYMVDLEANRARFFEVLRRDALHELVPPRKDCVSRVGGMVSAECFDLLRGLLRFEPAGRLSVHDALSHRWLQER